jgi:hypothetical protein
MPNISRKNMPQVDTQNLSKAINMVSDKVRVTKGKIAVSKLKKSQKELHKDKIEGIAARFTTPNKFKPLIISKDNHIVDGHHRWAAALYKWGTDVQIPIIRINLPILEAIELYKEVAQKLGQPVKEDINIPINIGDTILGGKFKNKRIVVKSIDKNEKGDITVNGKPLLKFRLVTEGTGESIRCSNCNHTWEIEFENDRPYLCHNCGYDSQMQKIDLVGLQDWKQSLKEDVELDQWFNNAEIVDEGTDNLEMLRLMTKAMKAFPQSPKQKEIIKKLNVLRIKNGMNPLGENVINEIPMGDLQKIDTFADKQLNPLDIVLTGRHFFDRLNDPRNGKEISNAELVRFFKRLSKKKKEFVEFLQTYNSVVATDDKTNINIPFMKAANSELKIIAKTIMRKKDFKTPDKTLDI